MKQFLVVGLGRFGRAVAEGLARGGGQVIGVDTDLALVDGAREHVAVAARVDTIDPETLRSVGAVEVDAAVVAIGEDFAAEILSVTVLREVGIEVIVARASSDRERRILELVGATRVVSVEVEMGERVARSLLGTDVLDHVSLGPGAAIVYWTADERVIGKRLADCGLRERWQIGVVAVRAAGRPSLDAWPDADYVFKPDDVLLLAGTEGRLAAFTK